MESFIYLLPVVAVMALLASGRVSLLAAGCVGTLLSVPAAWIAHRVALGDAANFDSMSTLVAHAGLRGSWIAWQAVSIILGGLLLYNVLNAARPDLFAPRRVMSKGISHHRLFTICFLLGPFVEAATGFGVGYLITISALMRLGLDAMQAVVFGLFSQMMVPWGALGVGTYIGAELAGIPIRELGMHTAVIYIALLFGYLLVFWGLAARFGHAPTLLERLDDLLWLCALCALLYAANAFIAVEVAGLACTAPLIVLRYLRHLGNRAATRGQSRKMLQAVLPYATLTLLLVGIRSVPLLNDFLHDLLVLRLPAAVAGDLPGYAVFHHGSFWLVAVAVGFGAWQLTRVQWRGVVTGVVSSARVPVLVSIIFLVMAQLLSLAGIPARLATVWVAIADVGAVAASPVMGIIAGLLTASNTASNGMLMVLQTELAMRVGADPGWIAAVQNVAGSNAILISPIRIAMGCALVAISGRESEVYRLVWPLGLVMLVVLECFSFIA
ncbi:MAG: lactate permease [Gammaproteobacteria bacterium]|jgi:lactate permease